MRQRTLILTALTALVLANSRADASSIGISFTPDGNDCDTFIQAFTPVTWYIFAYLYGDPAFCGISGAEFRQDGSPSSWFLSPVPSPVAISSMGNPIAGGCSVAFPPCQGGMSGLVLLYTINGFAVSQVTNVTLRILPHTTPSHPNFACPVLFLCDTPATRLCVAGGEAFINGTVCHVAYAPRTAGDCPVSIEPATWSGVKSLFD
jgi:hypothetical protein